MYTRFILFKKILTHQVWDDDEQYVLYVLADTMDCVTLMQLNCHLDVYLFFVRMFFAVKYKTNKIWINEIGLMLF